MPKTLVALWNCRRIPQPEFFDFKQPSVTMSYGDAGDACSSKQQRIPGNGDTHLFSSGETACTSVGRPCPAFLLRLIGPTPRLPRIHSRPGSPYRPATPEPPQRVFRHLLYEQCEETDMSFKHGMSKIAIEAALAAQGIR
jgi:hypothetical protein